MLLLRDVIQFHPSIFGPLSRLRSPKYSMKRWARAGDGLVIDGYPRSANTYLTVALMMKVDERVRIGNHCHAPAHFLRANSLQIPAILVIRPPVEAIKSFLVYKGSMDAKKELIRYYRFHEFLIKKQPKLVIAKFEDTIIDVNPTIKELNDKYNTHIKQFSINEDQNSLISTMVKKYELQFANKKKMSEQDRLRRTAVNNHKKDSLKQIINESLNSQSIHPYILRAKEAHDLCLQLYK